MDTNEKGTDKTAGEWMIWVGLFILPMLFYPMALSSPWVSDTDVHALLEFAASAIAMIAGSMILIHFFATGRLFFLLISLGFILQGAEDLVHAIYSFSRIWEETPEGMANFIPGTYVGGRLVLVICILIAWYIEKRGLFTENTKKAVMISIPIGFISAALITILIINSPLPQFILPGQAISRPVDFVAGLIYLIAFGLFVSLYQEKEHHTPFIQYMTVSLIFGTVTQIYMVHSQSLYDAQFDLSHVIKIFSYIFPIIGISLGTLRMYRKEESTANELSNALETERNLIENISEASSVFESLANKLMTSTVQLMSSASETASIVKEAVATAEETRQTAQVSNEKAQAVSRTGRESEQAAQTGKKSVTETVEGMDRIKTQMESAAETIVRLSEQSLTVGEIITTVNTLADQSNLLAVNASIEAAKAGEEGKGFAVVAQEIRNLADQSKESTVQIRQILSEIQKGVSTAVMATEQGAKTVDEATQQGAETANAIQALAATITESAQTAVQIGISSQQQITGMEQLVTAMESINQATQQNVASVNQLQQGAKDLQRMGNKLNQLVSPGNNAKAGETPPELSEEGTEAKVDYESV